MKSNTIDIQGRLVLICNGKTAAYFTAGEHGARERGWFNFWTAVGTDKLGDWKITGRARARLPPWDRFTRMEGERKTAQSKKARLSYSRMWRRLKTAQFIRPATEREVAGWESTHEADAKYITGYKFDGKDRVRIAKWPC